MVVKIFLFVFPLKVYLSNGQLATEVEVFKDKPIGAFVQEGEQVDLFKVITCLDLDQSNIKGAMSSN